VASRKNINFGNVCRSLARRQPDAAALSDGGNEATWSELDKSTDQLALGLAGLGVGFGKRVAIVASPSVECCKILVATLKLGGVVVIFEEGLSSQWVADALEASGCRICITDTARRAWLEPVRRTRPDLVEIVIDAEPDDDFSLPSPMQGYTTAGHADVPANAAAIITYVCNADGLHSVELSHQDLLVLAADFSTQAWEWESDVG
jgi:acyl-CoA synthetase (AMP-forming)/AMP-acid ligase II